MIVKLNYGGSDVELEVPDRNLAGVLRANDAHGLQLSAETAFDLRQGLHKFLAGVRCVLLVVNDHTRPTPSEAVLGLIESELADKEVWTVIACGSHTAPSEVQQRRILGRFFDRHKSNIVVHDARDKARLKFLGKTRFGTEAWISELAFKCDRLVTINSVEPHYFAGYTGGRKSILPGISSLDTITMNHRLALDPAARTLALKGNPVHEDMTEVAKMLPRPVFSIQVVIDNDHNLCGIHHGDLFKSFAAAIPDANRVFCVPLKARADIVIAVSGAPYDVNFYQQQKALENGKLALKDGGILIGMSACRDGLGDDTFVRLLGSVKTPADAIEKIRADFVLGYHKSAKLAEMMLTGEVWNVVPVAPALVQSIFMTPYPDVNQALQAALHKKGHGAQVLVLPDASLTVPMLRD